ncbi:DNA methyltransferase [Persephonella sp.]
MVSLERERSFDLDFKEFKASEGRHSIHDYPAMLHYLLVNHFIEKYSDENSLVYDPFCGSGVSVVESLRLNRKAIGTDINPLALLIADVRAFNIDVNLVYEYLENLEIQWKTLTPDIPSVKNIDFWFKDFVIVNLGKIRNFVKQIEDQKILKLFLVAFSQTVRDVSNNRKGEFKRYRLDEKRLKEFNPDVFKTFMDNTSKYLNVLRKDKLPSQNYSLFLHDVRKEVPISNVDLVITSPPYGDSKTTVAYGQFSSFSLDWIRGLNPYGDSDLKLDSLCLGGKKIKDQKELPSQHLYNALQDIERIDEKRALEVYSFFYDYYLSIKQIVKTLNNNAYVCFIVGNRTVKGIQIEMDFITAEFFESFGLSLENIFVREISNKRMPSKNSPSNKAGKTSNTMLYEYIVVMKKSG